MKHPFEALAAEEAAEREAETLEGLKAVGAALAPYLQDAGPLFRQFTVTFWARMADGALILRGFHMASPGQMPDPPLSAIDDTVRVPPAAEEAAELLPSDIAAGERIARSRAEMRERNRRLVAEMEAAAVRITVGNDGRCFEMADGGLLTIRNEPQPGDEALGIVRICHLLPTTSEDAEDFYGWSAPSPHEPGAPNPKVNG